MIICYLIVIVNIWFIIIVSRLSFFRKFQKHLSSRNFVKNCQNDISGYGSSRPPIFKKKREIFWYFIYFKSRHNGSIFKFWLYYCPIHIWQVLVQRWKLNFDSNPPLCIFDKCSIFCQCGYGLTTLSIRAYSLNLNINLFMLFIILIVNLT